MVQHDNCKISVLSKIIKELASKAFRQTPVVSLTQVELTEESAGTLPVGPLGSL